MNPARSAARPAEAVPAGLQLQCPRCRAAIDGLACRACGFSITVHQGVLHALAPESQAHFARFVADYERVRSGEGRGSDDAAFYLGLPYRDASGRDRAQWRMRARSYDYLRRHLLAGLAGGRILDLGAGNGWMSYRLARAGYRPCAVDLLTNDRDGLGAARHYRACLPVPFACVQADLAHLPLAGGQFDAAVFNASFHYAEDAVATLREALRCVRPGGVVIVSDTPWYSGDASGQRMVAERQAAFRRRWGIAGDTLASVHYLTDARLRQMADALSIRWQVHRPWYGLRWALRPLLAALRRQREPSRFRLYVARKAG
jgi:SAM-dependent methyltransferase